MGKDNLDSSVKTKFQSLFEKINEPKYVLDNYYSDNLINKIAENRKGDQYISTLSNLLVEPIKNLENYHVTVQVFLIRLLAICAHQDIFLAKSLSAIKNTLTKGYSGIGTPSMIPSLQVAYLEVALALLEQCTGVAWVVTTGVWREIISANNSSKTVFVTRQKYKFVSKLVWKLNDIDDETHLKQVLTLILKPLIESDIMIRKSITAEEEEEILKEFEPMLQMLHSVMREYSQLTLPSLVVNILLNQIKVLTHLFIVLDKFRMDILTSLITKLIFRFILAKIFYGKPLTDDTVHTAEDFVEISAAYFNTVNFFISRRNAMSVLDYCYSCNEIWNNMWGRKTPTMSTLDGKKVDIQNKMLFMCLIPAITYITRHMPVHEFQQEGNIQDYIMKLINASCEHTGKTCMLLSKLSLELDLDNIVLQSVKRLSSLNKTINNEQANIMFQGLFYVLKELAQSDCKGRANITPEAKFQEDQENMFMYTYVLDAILQLVKNYDINWHESLEVICLYNLVYGILQKLSSSSKFVVTALNVIAVTVRKFLPPNLSLLMDSKPGSAIHDLGRLIYMKMHDMHWEVRDSALELLHTCTEISYIKFPPFQKQIIENELIVVAAAIALNDHEVYVRASALRCLGAASKVAAVWDQLKAKHPDIQDSLLNVLQHNPEGIVRKEACHVLCDIYQNVKLCPRFRLALHEQMVAAAISDFHWEVQIAALTFWKMVICHNLSEQGMLDGTFPPVTFSKESRKIVTLNKTEIQKRLMKTLDELASVGCLTVLTKLLHEDTEVEVMDKNLTISLDFLNILKHYEVPECLKPVEGEPRTIQEYYTVKTKEENMDEDDVVVKKEPNDESDNVIESIINVDDMNLLAHIYERHMQLQNEKPELLPKPMIKLMRYVQPYLYVNHLMSKDFKTVIEYKKQWRDGIRSVESILDDVLGVYEIGQDVNTLDCY